jgi:hypothetical protein
MLVQGASLTMGTDDWHDMHPPPLPPDKGVHHFFMMASGCRREDLKSETWPFPVMLEKRQAVSVHVACTCQGNAHVRGMHMSGVSYTVLSTGETSSVSEAPRKMLLRS